ncbi:MAG: hypothetical protein ACFFA7_07435 [Promethearchaeota archaeon]
MKNNKTIILLILFCFFSLCLFTLTVKAHNPQNMVLAYDFSKQELNVTITHNVVNPNTHYIELVEIRVNGSIVLSEGYTSQPTTSTFMYQFNVTAKHGATIQARAFCSISGSISRTIDVINPNVKPSSFILSSNAGSPDPDGIFDLTWTTAFGVDNYSLFRHSSFISEINSTLTTLANQTALSPFPLSGFSNGTYYFIVRAYNRIGVTDSNVISVTVLITSGNGEPLSNIPGYGLIWIISIVIFVTGIIIKRIFKKS